jgi:hypothetical protein
LVGIGVEGRHGLELETEVADAREQAVQVRLVDDLADEFGGAGAPHESHAVERSREMLAQTLAYRDPNPSRRSHVDPTIAPACVRTHHAGPVSPRAIRADEPAKLGFAVGRVNESER